MNNRLGKDFFKISAIATGILYAAVTLIFLYCTCIVGLPAFCKFLVNSFKATLDFLSGGDPNMLTFYKVFFITCTVGLIGTGITLKVLDFKKYGEEILDISTSSSCTMYIKYYRLFFIFRKSFHIPENALILA